MAAIVKDNINISRLLSKSRTIILTGCSKLEVSMYTAVNKVEGVRDLIEARIQVHEAKEQNWDEVLARVQTYAARATEKIKLDIGGQIFAASKSLLVSFKDSFFSALLSSGRWLPGQDGCYFVDRTPTVYFATMIHFMRTGQFEIQHFTETQRSLLEEEFDFFQIPLPISFATSRCVGRLVHTTWLGKHDTIPYKLAESMNGEVFISDYSKHRIDVFTKDGYLLRSWGRLGQESGQFNYPAGISAISAINEVFVADRANHRVQVFDLSGKFLRKWGLYGTQDGFGYFSNPTNITVSADGEVFVIHNGKGVRVCKYFLWMEHLSVPGVAPLLGMLMVSLYPWILCLWWIVGRIVSMFLIDLVCLYDGGDRKGLQLVSLTIQKVLPCRVWAKYL